MKKSAKKKPQPASLLKPSVSTPSGKRHGLGKGLGSLLGPVPAKPNIVQQPSQPIPAKQAIEPSANAVAQINVSIIERCPWQPRQAFDGPELQELAESIQAQGVIQPLLCRRIGEKVELIAGERRLRAAIQAGLKTVPVLFLNLGDHQAATANLIENIQRKDLNPIEEAEGYRMLAEQFQLTQESIATTVGKPRATIANALRLLELPDEVKQLVADGRLSMGLAKVLLGVADADEQVALARRCILEGLTVRALETLLARRSPERPTSQLTSKPDMPPSYVQDLSDRLHRYFGTAIRLTPSVTYANGRHGKGCLEVDFYNNEDLTRILNLLNISVD